MKEWRFLIRHPRSSWYKMFSIGSYFLTIFNTLSPAWRVWCVLAQIRCHSLAYRAGQPEPLKFYIFSHNDSKIIVDTCFLQIANSEDILAVFMAHGKHLPRSLLRELCVTLCCRLRSHANSCRDCSYRSRSYWWESISSDCLYAPLYIDRTSLLLVSWWYVLYTVHSQHVVQISSISETGGELRLIYLQACADIKQCEADYMGLSKKDNLCNDWRWLLSQWWWPEAVMIQKQDRCCKLLLDTGNLNWQAIASHERLNEDSEAQAHRRLRWSGQPRFISTHPLVCILSKSGQLSQQIPGSWKDTKYERMVWATSIWCPNECWNKQGTRGPSSDHDTILITRWLCLSPDETLPQVIWPRMARVTVVCASLLPMRRSRNRG